MKIEVAEVTVKMTAEEAALLSSFLAYYLKDKNVNERKEYQVAQDLHTCLTTLKKSE